MPVAPLPPPLLPPGHQSEGSASIALLRRRSNVLKHAGHAAFCRRCAARPSDFQNEGAAHTAKAKRVRRSHSCLPIALEARRQQRRRGCAILPFAAAAAAMTARQRLPLAQAAQEWPGRRNGALSLILAAAATEIVR